MSKTTNKTKAQTPKTSIVSEVEARWNEIAKDEKPAAETPKLVDASEKPQNNRVKNEGSGTPFPTREVGAGVVAERVSLKIVDGKFDAESLRSETAERVREVMKNTVADPEARKQFGLTAEAAPVKAITVSPETIGGVFDACAKGQALLLCRKTGLEYKEIYPLVKWDKDEHDFLDPRGAALANKYMPESWLRYGDLTVFLASFAQLMQAKSKAVEDYARKRLEAIGAAGPQPQSSAGSSSQPPKGAIVAATDIPPEQKSRSLE